MQLLRFPNLAAIPHLKHALTTRDGGVSQGDFTSLNLAFHVADNSDDVVKNRRLLAQELGYSAGALVAAQQVHGDRITIVDELDAGKGANDWDSAIANTDALVTSEVETPLLILVADCAPILLADPEHQVLAVVHAGWRGAVARIASQTVERMASAFGSQPESILAGVGPCLNIENLEIGFEVAEEVEKVDPLAVISGWEKPHLDLRGLIQRDLQSVGVPIQNIEVMPHCSKDDERFFSHRGQNGKAGRFGIVAWWENS
ncbi:peptidoglycan editing factor PgeF [bacterium]|nr:MAG: peptidoglycan editing factor PgeF [bacterium]